MTTQSLHALHPGPRLRPTATPHGVCTAHFGELHGPLLDFIAGSEVIVGCVAWITSGRILDALATRPVALVVQKENWWKKTDTRGQTLAGRYAGLTGGLAASAFPPPLATKTFRGKPVPNDLVLAPISCIGYSRAQSRFAPLMHHKFIVRCRIEKTGAVEVLVPLAAWTGSFNFSGNANDSFENALEIHDPVIAAAYLAEFALMASLSESMNWRTAAPRPGPGKVFVPMPAKPKSTTTRTVRKSSARKRPTRKASAAPAKVTPVRPSRRIPTKRARAVRGRAA
ncbi:hypothetical protein [Nocardioides sp. InS609-2]|uniref:hypothetical protein n=1 Tax=Nocardioides sp. InS609-2 TaxID=2760705 RepID=UPI0020C016E3|nr:hypothetical protein [Nocardioides sp. InS609-2]